MNNIYSLFLNAIKCSLNDEPVNWDHEISLKEWGELYRLASIHEVVPLFVHTVYHCTSLQKYSSFRNAMYHQAQKITVLQAQKSADFSLLYQKMLQNGLKPLIMKGIICRNLYPNPEQRPSIDEDFLIFPYQIEQYHQFLIHNGFSMIDPSINLIQADEVSYINKENSLYLEIHKYLFPVTGSAYSDLNSLFSVLEERKIETIYHTDIRTFSYSDHFLYMICHAYKHFLHSGVGIRQLCDMCLFAQKYDTEINWARIYESCKLFHIEQFMIAIMNICEKYLSLQPGKIGYHSFWDSELIDETALLEDILSGGLYGAASEDRLHSGTMTLEVVRAHKEGKKSNGLIKTVFPTVTYMTKKYPYVKKHKCLLPVAWGHRWYDYLKEKTKKKTSPAKTIEIANNRIGLLHQYHIID